MNVWLLIKRPIKLACHAGKLNFPLKYSVSLSFLSAIVRFIIKIEDKFKNHVNWFISSIKYQLITSQVLLFGHIIYCCFPFNDNDTRTYIIISSLVVQKLSPLITSTTTDRPTTIFPSVVPLDAPDSTHNTSIHIFFHIYLF